MKKQHPKLDGDSFKHLEAEKIHFNHKWDKNPSRQKAKSEYKPILSGDENLANPFGFQGVPFQGLTRKVTDNQKIIFQNKESNFRNFDAASTELFYKGFTSKFGYQKDSMASYCTGVAAPSFKQIKHPTPEYQNLEVERAKSNDAMEYSDYFDYISSKAQEISKGKETSWEEFNVNITCIPPEKQPQLAKEELKYKSENYIQDLSLTLNSMDPTTISKTETQELDYSFLQTHLLNLAPSQISSNPSFSFKGNPRPLEELKSNTSLKNSYSSDGLNNTLKPTIQKDQHSNPDQAVKKINLGELQSPKSMQSLSNFNLPASQSETSTQTKPLETPKLICSKSAKGSDLEENFSNLTNQIKIFSIMDAFSLSMGKLGDSCTEDFILSHQKQGQLNNMALFTQIGNMIYALTDFVTEKLSISSFSAQVKFTCT